MSLLTIIQNVCAEIDLDSPTAITSSADPQLKQLQILSYRAGKDLLKDHDWSVLNTVRNFTATGVTPEPTEPPSDFSNFTANSVIWNTSRLWQLSGPVEPQTWERNTIFNSNPVPQIWRMLGGKLAIFPNVATETMRYEYISKNWIAVMGGSTYAEKWANDTDTSRIPEDLIELSLIWRWKRAKGLDFGEELENYERAKESAIGADRAAQPISLSMPNRGEVPDNYWPGTIIPNP